MNAHPLTSLDEALAALLAQAAPLGRSETVTLFDADGRVLAEPLVSALQVPPLDNSAMDGYALRAADAAAPGAVLPVTQRIAAGQTGAPLAAGSAARIFTGAPLPPGADCVVMQEEAEPLEGGARVRLRNAAQPGQCVRRAGEDVARGSQVLRQGERLLPASIGLAAGVGAARLNVAARPRVALLCTGDELVMPGSVAPQDLPPGAIYNSNRYFLRALLLRLGCQVSDLGSVPDNLAATQAALAQAAQGHDVILSSGGVSVGDEDHVKPAVQQLGALQLWRIAIKPGKPFTYGHVRRTPGAASATDADAAHAAPPPGTPGAAHFIGLPGNPVSSFVTFLLLVRPFLLRLMGVPLAEAAALPASPLRAAFDWPRPGKGREFLRARRNAQGEVELFAHQGSGVLTSLHWADGLVDLPAGHTVARGQAVRFISLQELLA